MNEERRLPPFAEDTLALLTDAAGGTGEGFPRDAAIGVIADDERRLIMSNDRGSRFKMISLTGKNMGSNTHGTATELRQVWMITERPEGPPKWGR